MSATEPAETCSHCQELARETARLRDELRQALVALTHAPRPDRWPETPYRHWYYDVRWRVLRGRAAEIRREAEMEARSRELAEHGLPPSHGYQWPPPEFQRTVLPSTGPMAQHGGG